MRIGYARVSTDDQNIDLQQDALRQARVDKNYEDKASGKSLDRRQLAECLGSLRQGDTLIVWRLDRLGRSVKDLVALISELRDRWRRNCAGICSQRLEYWLLAHEAGGVESARRKSSTSM